MPEKTVLAIVIPAYKAEFLNQTLSSLANQTCQDFKLYIGDDASPYDLKSVVDSYTRRMSVSYTRFDKNLGKEDLVAHWNRCIKLAETEEWIWLFSDDDLMEPRCVESFYKHLDKIANYDVVHFNIDIVDGNNQILHKGMPYPEVTSSQSFYYNLYRGRISARMPEFLFRRKALMDKGGFVHFDLAWRSDNATVMMMSHPKGCYSIADSGTRIKWRLSNSNVSSEKNEVIIKRKNEATIKFFNWVFFFFQSNHITNPFPTILQIRAFVFNIQIVQRSKAVHELERAINQYSFINSTNKRILAKILIYYRLYLKNR